LMLCVRGGLSYGVDGGCWMALVEWVVGVL
jgi:hypothetical protein